MSRTGFRAHGCGARVEIHAGHFAEEIAGAEFGDGVAVGEIDGGVDRNGAVARFSHAFIFFAADQRTFQFFEKAACAPFGFHVSDRRGDRNLRFAFQDVEGRGAEITFAADDVALAEASLYDCAAIQLQEGSGDAGEDRQFVEFFGRERRVGFHCQLRTSHAFIGQRARGTRNHTFAAGDAGGVAHRCVQIEGDTR